MKKILIGTLVIGISFLNNVYAAMPAVLGNDGSLVNNVVVEQVECITQENTLNSNIRTDIETVNVAKKINKEAYEYAKFLLSETKKQDDFTAFELLEYKYINAMNAINDGEKNKGLANLLNDVNIEFSNNRNNPDVNLFASQIYRAMGGIAYAKQSFCKAIEGYRQEIALNKGDAKTYMKYAIACNAGDVRNWIDYDTYLMQSKEFAKLSVSTCAKNIEYINTALESDMFEDSEKSALKNELKIQKNLYLELTLLNSLINNENDSVELYAQFKDVLGEKKANICINYELAQSGKWHWKVFNADAAKKEFLLSWLR